MFHPLRMVQTNMVPVIGNLEPIIANYDMHRANANRSSKMFADSVSEIISSSRNSIDESATNEMFCCGICLEIGEYWNLGLRKSIPSKSKRNSLHDITPMDFLF